MRHTLIIGLALVFGVCGCTDEKTEEEKTKTKGPNAADRHDNEASAIGALKTITNSQSMFREGDKEGDSNEDYGTLKELADQDLIDKVLGSGTKNGYVFEVSYGPETSEYIWWATANPVEPGVTGDRYFACNHEGVTFYSEKGPIKVDKVKCNWKRKPWGGDDTSEWVDKDSDVDAVGK